MPIEIMELVVKASIMEQQEKKQQQQGEDDCGCKKAAKEASVAQVMDLIKRQKER